MSCCCPTHDDPGVTTVAIDLPIGEIVWTTDSQAALRAAGYESAYVVHDRSGPAADGSVTSLVVAVEPENASQVRRLPLFRRLAPDGTQLLLTRGDPPFKDWDDPTDDSPARGLGHSFSWLRVLDNGDVVLVSRALLEVALKPPRMFAGCRVRRISAGGLLLWERDLWTAGDNWVWFRQAAVGRNGHWAVYGKAFDGVNPDQFPNRMFLGDPNGNLLPGNHFPDDMGGSWRTEEIHEINLPATHSGGLYETALGTRMIVGTGPSVSLAVNKPSSPTKVDVALMHEFTVDTDLPATLTVRGQRSNDELPPRFTSLATAPGGYGDVYYAVGWRTLEGLRTPIYGGPPAVATHITTWSTGSFGVGGISFPPSPVPGPQNPPGHIDRIGQATAWAGGLAYLEDRFPLDLAHAPGGIKYLFNISGEDPVDHPLGFYQSWESRIDLFSGAVNGLWIHPADDLSQRTLVYLPRSQYRILLANDDGWIVAGGPTWLCGIDATDPRSPRLAWVRSWRVSARSAQAQGDRLVLGVHRCRRHDLGGLLSDYPTLDFSTFPRPTNSAWIVQRKVNQLGRFGWAVHLDDGATVEVDGDGIVLRPEEGTAVMFPDRARLIQQ